jgi:ankyrin repeat protein
MEFFKAVVNGDFDQVKKLIDEGADVNKKFGSGDIDEEDDHFDGNISDEPILHIACWKGHFEICKVLIEKGADVNAKGRNCTTGTALICAIDSTFVGCEFNLKKFKIIQLLIEKGANVNQTNDDGLTPLMCASSSGLMIVCELLIENGADVNIKQDSECGEIAGKTALMHACTYQDYQTSKHYETCKLLIKNGADVNARDECGMTALYHAKHEYTFTFEKDLSKLLVRQGATM